MIVKIGSGTQQQRRAARKAINWCADKLLSKRLIPNIYIEVIIRDMTKDNCLGFCSWTEDNLRPRDFLIEIDNRQGSKRFLQTIFHEMTHLKQYAKNELKEYLRETKILWKGQVATNFNYRKCPWEIEAYKTEKELYKLMQVEGVCKEYTWGEKYHWIKDKKISKDLICQITQQKK